MTILQSLYQALYGGKSYINKTALLGLSLFLLVHPAVHAQTSAPNSPLVLVDMIVEGEAPPLDYPSANQSFYNEKQLEIGHERSVDEILEGEPGVNIQRQSNNGRLFIRGVNGAGTLSLDGMPMLDSQKNTLNLTSQIADGLESVEVNRGPAQASHAFAALGGEVKMRSKQAEKTGISSRVEGGAFGYMRGSLQTNFAGEKLRFSMTANHTNTVDGSYQALPSLGNTERDPYTNTQILARADMDFSPILSWQGSMLYRNNFQNTDGFELVKGVVQQMDRNTYSIDEIWMVQNALRARITPNWTMRWQLGYEQNFLRNTTPSSRISIAAQLFLARWENEQKLFERGKSKLSLIWGMEDRYETGRYPTQTAFNKPNQFAENNRNGTTGFVDARWQFGSLSGDAGFRYQSYDIAGGQSLFHTGVAWQASNTVKIKANAGSGYRLPSYSEWLFPTANNIPLRLLPESNVGGDFGIEWQANEKIKWSASGFYSRYENLITPMWNLSRANPVCTIGICVDNLPQSVIAGLESGLEWRIHDRLRSGLSYTYTGSENLANHKQLPMRSPHSLRAFGEWRLPNMPLTFWAEGIYRSYSFNDIENTMQVGESFRINVHANYQISTALNVYVRGENLTNDQTSNTYSFYQNGASIFGGFQLKFY